MKKGAIIGIVCGAIAVVAGAAGTGAYLFFNSPEMKVTRATANFFTEMDAHTEELEKASKIKSDVDFDKDPYHAVIDFDVYDVLGDNETNASISADVLCDNKDKKLVEEIKIEAMNMEWATLVMAADDKSVYFGVPELFDGTVSFDQENIIEQYNNSPMTELLGEQIDTDEDVSFEIFTKKSDKNFYEANEETINEMIKNAEIEKVDGKLEVSVGDKEVKCTGYAITFKEDDVNKLMEEAYGENLLSVEEDLELVVYMDNKCNIRQIQTDENIDVEETGQVTSIAFRFVGEDNAFDEMNFKMCMDIEGEEVEFTMDYTTTYEKSVLSQNIDMGFAVEDIEYLTADFVNERNTKDKTMKYEFTSDLDGTELAFVLAGTYAEDGSSYEFTDGALTLDGEKLAGFDLSVFVEKYKEEITMPEGEVYRIFEMSEADFEEFGMEIVENLEIYIEDHGLEEFLYGESYYEDDYDFEDDYGYEDDEWYYEEDYGYEDDYDYGLEDYYDYDESGLVDLTEDEYNEFIELLYSGEDGMFEASDGTIYFYYSDGSYIKVAADSDF